jgi:hypothetical protein
MSPSSIHFSAEFKVDGLKLRDLLTMQAVAEVTVIIKFIISTNNGRISIAVSIPGYRDANPPVYMGRRPFWGAEYEILLSAPTLCFLYVIYVMTSAI